MAALHVLMKARVGVLYYASFAKLPYSPVRFNAYLALLNIQLLKISAVQCDGLNADIGDHFASSYRQFA